MIKSLSEASIKQYNAPLKFWLEYCKRMKKDPFRASEQEVLDCLAIKFAEGAAYGSINTMRSAISLINENKLSDSLAINRFLKGVFRIKPATPKYDSTWDPNKVLKMLQTWIPLEDLSLAKISEKLVMLLALGSGFRVQSITLIKLDNVIYKRDGIEIRIADLIKTSKPGAPQPVSFFPYFKEKPEICIAKTLDQYISRTKSLRKDENQLLISCKKPYKAVGTQTVSRWIKNVLKEAGIEDYTAHSTRHASSSKALAQGLNVNIIKKAAGWAPNSNTFAKFYNRPLEAEDNFARKVFADQL